MAGRRMLARGAVVVEWSLPTKRGHRARVHAGASKGACARGAPGCSASVWSRPAGVEGREERVGQGDGLGGRPRGLLHRRKHDGVATERLLPGVGASRRPLGRFLDALVLEGGSKSGEEQWGAGNR